MASTNPNCGGRVGFSKRALYNGVWLESSWEVDLAKWLDAHGIDWVRPDSIVYIDESGIKRRYHPDFLLPYLSVYVDPKNKYLLARQACKLAAVEASSGIRVIAGELHSIKDELAKLVDRLGLAPSTPGCKPSVFLAITNGP